MTDRPDDGGELVPGETYVALSGRCKLRAACTLTCVAPPPDHGYTAVAFEAGEEHGYDRLEWKNKNGSRGWGFVIRTGDGDAYLMPHLFECWCEVIGDPAVDAGQPVAQPAQPTKQPCRPIRVVNVKGLNKPEQRANVVYVGRKFAGWPQHELHNPFKVKAGEPAGAALAKYKAKLLTRLTIEQDLAALWEETGHGARPLGCWCCTAVAGDGQEIVCHGQILAELLLERFGST